jgi:hypothetical protein
VTKRKGIQGGQSTKIQEQMMERAHQLVGNEMIFELAELAKVYFILSIKGDWFRNCSLPFLKKKFPFMMKCCNENW